MSASWQTDAGGLWAEIKAGSSLDFIVPFPELDPGDTIASAVWTSDSGITVAHTSVQAATATAWIGGGVGGSWYLATCTATTAAGQILVVPFRVYVADAATLGAGITSCFPSLAGAVATIRRDRLVVAARTYLGGVDISDDYILEKLVVAEADLQRRLRAWFTPREVIPESADPAEAAALIAAGEVVEYEPNYDFRPEFFDSDTWGFLELRHRPAIAVHSITFVWPTQATPLYTIPIDWVRLDRQFGKINIVPTQSTLTVPLNTFMLSALGGGNFIPQMIQIRYRAGLTNAATHWPDLLDLIKKAAVLSMIEDGFAPSSISDSADGLSQSMSADVEKLNATIERKVETLRSKLHGISLAVI